MFKNYYVTTQIFKEYGIPYIFYTDNRTVFEYRRKGEKNTEKDTFTQFGYMCHNLGIALETTSISQAKGKIKRLFQALIVISGKMVKIMYSLIKKEEVYDKEKVLDIYRKQ